MKPTSESVYAHLPPTVILLAACLVLYTDGTRGRINEGDRKGDAGLRSMTNALAAGGVLVALAAVVILLLALLTR